MEITSRWRVGLDLKSKWMRVGARASWIEYRWVLGMKYLDCQIHYDSTGFIYYKSQVYTMDPIAG